MAIHITGDDRADQVLTDDPFALLLGMLLDQQFPMERAFAGPAVVLERFGTLDPHELAHADEAEFAALCAKPPAVHRYPGSMAGRMQALARTVEDQYAGRADRIWTEAMDATDLFGRLKALPGFGEQKSRIFVALLAKRVGVRPEGWERIAGAYAEDGFRSVADVVDAQSLQRVRDYKKQQKARARQ